MLKQNEEEMLVQAIERLSPKYKDVIVLFHFIDMSLEEVSVTLELPVNTVKTRLLVENSQRLMNMGKMAEQSIRL